MWWLLLQGQLKTVEFDNVDSPYRLVLYSF